MDNLDTALGDIIKVNSSNSKKGPKKGGRGGRGGRNGRAGGGRRQQQQQQSGPARRERTRNRPAPYQQPFQQQQLQQVGLAAGSVVLVSDLVPISFPPSLLFDSCVYL